MICPTRHAALYFCCGIATFSGVISWFCIGPNSSIETEPQKSAQVRKEKYNTEKADYITKERTNIKVLQKKQKKQSN